jgi:hypothetical protein
MINREANFFNRIVSKQPCCYYYYYKREKISDLYKLETRPSSRRRRNEEGIITI